MRWYKKDKRFEEIRYKKKFAFFPIKINNEVRWLETVYLKQERWYSWYEAGWDNTAFLTEEEFIGCLAADAQKEFSKQLECFYHCFDENCKYNNKHWCKLGHEAMVDNSGICHSREVK